MTEALCFTVNYFSNFNVKSFGIETRQNKGYRSRSKHAFWAVKSGIAIFVFRSRR